MEFRSNSRVGRGVIAGDDSSGDDGDGDGGAADAGCSSSAVGTQLLPGEFWRRGFSPVALAIKRGALVVQILARHSGASDEGDDKEDVQDRILNEYKECRFPLQRDGHYIAISNTT
ncbi:hypothetical protein Tsubulata_012505 [Turnera subulata]|uniref:Uncharacterized protein n=1 Tax=Turnera subulata TaxID=218843 RepID=A0A9Q0J0S1_9ROSI|nr:hypothetical protein Tsubulata_012505 [Turnera subulata]